MSKKGKTEMAKKEEPKSQSRPVNPKTACSVGSIGNEIGEAYLKATTHEQAVAGMEEIVAASFKRKGKSEAKEHVHKHAMAWLGYLRERMPNFKELPKSEKPKAAKPAAKKAAKPAAKKSAKKAAAKPAAKTEKPEPVTVA